MEVGTLISSDLESPPKEETTALQRSDVNNSDLMGAGEPHELSNIDEEDPGMKALPHLDLGKTSRDQQRDASNWCSHSHECTATVEYGVKLGYDRNRILAVLRRRGSDISRDELLKELTAENSQVTSCGLSESAFSVTSANDEMRQTTEENPSPLRPIIIDGSNVAMSHGNKKVFSCRGIEIAVDWFKQRGHKEITVFVPQWRKENARQVSQITNQEILSALEQDKIVVFTPSRRVKNKRIVCYDDRYILQLAVDNGGIVVSNDNYRDLLSEKPEFKKVIEERLLMYSFVNDRFMPPDDPLGRHGPKLDNFLKMNPTSSGSSLQPCPYGKKCTYGNKCRFFHPGRPQRSIVTPTQPITGASSQNKIKDLRQRERGVGGNSRESPAFDRLNLGDPNMPPSRLPSELVDLSPVAISLLSGSGGKNQCRSGADGGLGRRSLPLPWPSTLGVYHRNLRSVQSDPYAGCNGHMAVARELYAGNCFAEQKLQQAACNRGARSDALWTEDMKTDEFKNETRHAVLCRKPSVGVDLEKSAKSTQKVPPFGSAILVSANRGLSKRWTNGGHGLFSEHDHLSRMHSDPILCQRTADEKDLAASLQPQPQQKMLLHRVNTSPLARDDTMTSFHARGGHDFMSSGGNATGAFANPFGDNGWMTGVSPCQAKHSDGFLSEFSATDKRSPFATATDLPSRNLASFTSVHQPPSTFHFGLNSSYRFVPALPSNVIIPPYDGCRIPPGFSAENSGSAKNELFMRLCMLFEPDDVHRVMTEHPDKVDIKTLCAHLLQLDQQNKQPHVF